MKFELLQTAYYLKDNKVHSAPVLSRIFVENAHEDVVATSEQANFYMRFGGACILYSTCHGTVREEDAFESSQALAESLQTF